MKNKQFIALLYGWIVVLGLIIITSIILALFLQFTSLNEPTLSWITLTIGLIALFLGGLVAGVKGKSKGWIIGGFIGIGFTIFVLAVQYIGYQQLFSWVQSAHHLVYLVVAVIGGFLFLNTVVHLSDKTFI